MEGGSMMAAVHSGSFPATSAESDAGARILVQGRDAEANLVVYAISEAGTGASAWNVFRQHLPVRYGLRAIRLPGRESRSAEPPLTSVQDQAVDILHGLTKALAADPRPYALLGSCSGATVAYEVALLLDAASLPRPEFLAVAGQQAPWLAHSETAVRRSDQPGQDLLRWLAEGVAPPDLARLTAVFPLVERFIRADLQAHETYLRRSADLLSCPILVVRGARDQMVSEAACREWAHGTASGFALDTVQGGHQLLRTEPQVLADAVGRWHQATAGRDEQSDSRG